MNDRDLLIRTVIGEAANQDEVGQRAVAHVVLNRLKDKRWGNSVQDVLFQKHQFEPWNTRRSELMAIPTNSPQYRKAASVVDNLGEDPTGGATHFMNEQIVRQRRSGSLPKWANGMSRQQIGDHTFYGGGAGEDTLAGGEGASGYFRQNIGNEDVASGYFRAHFQTEREPSINKKAPKAPKGLNTPGPPSLLDRAVDTVGDVAQGAHDLVMGDAEFDVPEVATRPDAVEALAGEGGIDSTEVSRRLFAAQDEQAMATIIKDIAPDVQIISDNNDNLYADIDGERFALDKAGLSRRDVAELIKGTVLALSAHAGGRLGRAVVGPIGRWAGAGAGAAGEETLEQYMSNLAGDGRGLEALPILAAGVFGVSGEAAQHAIERLGPSVWASIFKASSKAKSPEALKRSLQEMGVGLQEIGRVLQTRDTAKTAEELGDAAVARMIKARSLPVPIELTTGQATRNPALFTAEDVARSTDLYGVDVQREAWGRSVAQQSALLENSRRMVPDQSGREARGRRVQDALVVRRDAANAQVNEAYKLAKAAPKQPAVSVDHLESFIHDSERRLARAFILEPDGKARQVIDDFRGLFRSPQVELRALEEWRSRATKARESSKGSESAAISALIRAYDGGSLDGLLRHAVGDKSAINLWRRAVKARAKFGRQYQQNDIIGKLTRNARDRRGELEIDPSDAMNELLGASLGKKGATREVLRLKRFLGEESPEWVAIQSEAIVRLLDFTPNDGLRDGKIRQNIVNNFRQAREKHPGIIDNVFSRNQLRALRRFADVVETINIPPRGAGDTNPSGSGKFAIQAGTKAFERLEKVAEAAGRFFGVGGRVITNELVKLVTGARNRAEAGAMRRSLRGLVPSPIPGPSVPGVGGSIGGETGASLFEQ